MQTKRVEMGGFRGNYFHNKRIIQNSLYRHSVPSVTKTNKKKL